MAYVNRYTKDVVTVLGICRIYRTPVIRKSQMRTTLYKAT